MTCEHHEFVKSGDPLIIEDGGTYHPWKSGKGSQVKSSHLLTVLIGIP